ncbi:AIPR family protein [Cryptosporangium japonicum]|uniref:AIPR family protein n=1 Tax=Cryptosporangium japonicum TaxID=80872 RepID=A0ABN0UBF1_9ACTN
MDAFKAEQSLEVLSESDAFEHFVNYCVIADSVDTEIDISDLHVGGADDLGLDGAAILVNGNLVTSSEEVIDLLAINGYLEVRFMFVQAKTSSTFSGMQMMTLFDGVDELFADEMTQAANAQVENLRSICDVVYENTIKLRPKPSLQIYYVTTGEWKEDANLVAKTNRRIGRLQQTGLFSSVNFTALGADELHQSYQNSKNSIVAEFNFANRTLLPDIDGVTEAYLGVVQASEFIRLIRDQAGNIRKSLFYDNVRDFQDVNNPVNAEIQNTLRDARARGRFAVLNNGVTIVARELRTVRNTFTLTDYQIVNGCQTSHVLFNEQENLGANVHIPLKVIATEDEDVVNSIITATNRQTQVTTENLMALSGFQKRIERYFASYAGKRRLYYERRSKQYNSSGNINRLQIITVSQLLRAFGAMFVDSPHRAIRYYQDLQEQVGRTIFNEDHKVDPYYVAGYAHYRLETLFRSGGGLNTFYKPARYHLLMCFRYLASSDQTLPALTANKVEPFCQRLAEQLWDEKKALDIFSKAAVLVDKALNGQPLTRDVVKVQAFTNSVKAELGIKPRIVLSKDDLVKRER